MASQGKCQLAYMCRVQYVAVGWSAYSRAVQIFLSGLDTVCQLTLWCCFSQGSSSSTARLVAETVQYFITAMDAVKMRMAAVDEVCTCRVPAVVDAMLCASLRKVSKGFSAMLLLAVTPKAPLQVSDLEMQV